MSKEKYFKVLRRMIRALPPGDLETILAFYQEIVEDKIENGVSESQAVMELGDVRALAGKILLENPNRRPKNTGMILGLTLGGLAVVSVLCIGIMAVFSSGSRTVDMMDTLDVSDGEEYTDGVGNTGEIINESMRDAISSMKQMRAELIEAPIPEGAKREFYSPESAVTEIKLDTDMKYVIVKKGENNKIEVAYDTDSTQTYTMDVKDGKLNLKNKDNRPHPRNFQIDSLFNRAQLKKRYYVILTLPQDYAGDLNVSVSRGWFYAEKLESMEKLHCASDLGVVDLTNMNAKKISLDTDMGLLLLNGARTDVLESTNSMGMLVLKDVDATDTADLDTDMGYITFHSLKAPEIKLYTEMGCIEGAVRGSQAEYQITRDNDMGYCVPGAKEGGPGKLDMTCSMGYIAVTFEG